MRADYHFTADRPSVTLHKAISAVSLHESSYADAPDGYSIRFTAEHLEVLRDLVEEVESLAAITT